MLREGVKEPGNLRNYETLRMNKWNCSCQEIREGYRVDAKINLRGKIHDVVHVVNVSLRIIELLAESISDACLFI